MKSESENMKENIQSQNTKERSTGSSQSKILTIPNLLSFFRLCLIPVFMWLYCVERNYLWTGIILIISGLTDTVDGIIARKFNMISDLGKVLDPIADKVTQAAMLFCLLTRFPLMIAPLALMVVKEFFMGVTGLLVIQKTGKVFGADWHGKVNTWLLYAMMIIHVFWYNIPDVVSKVLIGICVVMMLISLVLYGRHNLKALRETGTVK
ncbi:CDP-alcohol phosphatidyltransferase family protein [Mediterraneibacter glycyrrhizinilyticus]|uniref:CDP-alcohol phosphatidyltransferase family protein n=1 Tax=Mediterraneibacter glycyrrhizinilyticus TaxID=342942 RepID=UPI0025A4A0EE|nr:CDP-alcohol phosphatidyltransferase family protein [Mediterraneibacter glycyrrhizinilyticus]MDM8210925.1 CDP-alcohol phosphatidyltransferase family protein [Mediterraneibacter glycyrrhizinilyticus]